MVGHKNIWKIYRGNDYKIRNYEEIPKKKRYKLLTTKTSHRIDQQRCFQ